MAAHANLTEEQRERLEMLAEEAAEVVQACTKILRHGYASYHPDDPNRVTNKVLLTNELRDLWVVYERMALCYDLPRINFYVSHDHWDKKLKYTYHQKKPRD